jgi:hypothetical protein
MQKLVSREMCKKAAVFRGISAISSFSENFTENSRRDESSNNDLPAKAEPFKS